MTPEPGSFFFETRRPQPRHTLYGKRGQQDRRAPPRESQGTPASRKPGVDEPGSVASLPRLCGRLRSSGPDVPEAGTDGRTAEEALSLARDALATALAGYVHARREIPAPSALVEGRHLVPLPPVVAAKLALYSGMRAQGITNVALAAQLGVSEAAVRKLLNPDHRSHIGRVEVALKAIGRTLVVEDKAA